MRTGLSIMGLLVWLAVGSADAANIQFLIATGEVTGVSDQPVSVPTGYDVAQIPELASAIQWPVPSGCSVGRWEWTRITDPQGVTAAGGGMALRTDMAWFTTTSSLLPGCHMVTRWAQLEALIDQVGDREMVKIKQADWLSIAGTWYDRLCLDVDGQGDIVHSSNSNCVTAKGSLDALAPRLPSRAQLATLVGEMNTINTDACAFRAAQGTWGSC